MSRCTSLLLALAPLLIWTSCGSEAKDRRPSALLLTLDTTRADALGAYAAGKASDSVTPTLDRLAAESLVFDRAYTVAPLTLPAHASMLTGLVPPRHTVRDNGRNPLPSSATTLAELARAEGVRTAAFVAAVVLTESFGLDQGFEVYGEPAATENGRSRESTLYTERRADEVVAEALAWLGDVADAERFFLWVHLFDPHAPYAPPPGFPTGAEQRVRYRGEVAAMDAAVGRLLDGMRERGRYEDTTILVVADHGEGFGENGESSHGAFCYEGVMRVPLLLRAPTDQRAGERSMDVVSVVDVHATLAEALLLVPSNEVDGRSLLRERPAGGAYVESLSGYLNYGWSPLVGWVDAEGKYLHSSAPELFDLAADPNEERNVFFERPAQARRYRSALQELLARPGLEASSTDGATDEALLNRIRSLGYAAAGAETGSGIDVLAPGNRPSPSERKAEYERVIRALGLANAEEYAQAEPLFAAVVAENPENTFALEHLAHARMRLERYTEAIAPLRLLLERDERRVSTHYNLGACLWRSGAREQAIEALETALKLAPQERRTLRTLIPLLAELGRADRAAELQARLTGLEDGLR